MLGSLFSSFCAIGAGLKCGVHPHQVPATSSSTLSNAHENYSHFNDDHLLRLIVNSDSEGARFGSSKSQTTLRNKPSQLIVKLISIMISEGGRAPQLIMKSLILNSDGAQKMIVVSCNSKIFLILQNDHTIFCEGEWEHSAFDQNFTSGAASGRNMASGPAFGHNFASGVASGQNLAFGLIMVFGCNSAFGLFSFGLYVWKLFNS
jgi:hypothetical protein